MRFIYPTCDVCSTDCKSAHRKYSYEGYIGYLDRVTAPPTRGQLERDRMLSLISKADAEFGPGYIAGRCPVCFGHWCTRPHRKASREGYASFLMNIGYAKSGEEAMRMTDEKFEIDARPESSAVLGGRTQSNRYGDEGSKILDWEVENEIMFQAKRWNYGILRCSPQDIGRFGDLIKGEWTRKVSFDTQKYGRMPWDDIPWEMMHKLPARPEDAISWDRLKNLAPQPEEEIIFFKLRRLAPRPELEPGLPLLVRAGPRSSNHPIPPPQGPSKPTVGPGDENYEKARCLYYCPGDENYEMIRRLYTTKWDNRKEIGMSTDKIKGLRAAAQTSWVKRVGSNLGYERMPWQDDRSMRSCRPLCPPCPQRAQRPLYTAGDEIPEDVIERFLQEWSDMAFSGGGNAYEDPMQRYAVARIMQVSFERAIGSSGESEIDDMPWGDDLIRPVPELRESQTDTLLRAAFTTIFVNNTKGKDPRNEERLARTFREAWVRELGVRAADVKMRWDEVLVRKAERNVKMGWAGGKWH